VSKDDPFKKINGMPTYPNAHAKVKTWIFVAQFAGNWFEFGLILNYF